MAVTTKWFGLSLTGLVSATAARRFDWDNDTIKCMLCTSSYTPNQDTHDFKDDVTNEVSGTGYTAGGRTMTCSAPTYDTATNETRMDASDVSWTGASFTARYAVIYKDTGVASTSPVIAWVDFGGDVTVTAGTFTIQWHANGVIKITAS